MESSVTLLRAPLRWTFQDNSQGGFVRHAPQEARDFSVDAQFAADNSRANCRLESSSHFPALAQPKCQPQLATQPKNHAPTKRRKPAAPAAIVQSVPATRGQFKAVRGPLSFVLCPLRRSNNHQPSVFNQQSSPRISLRIRLDPFEADTQSPPTRCIGWANQAIQRVSTVLPSSFHPPPLPHIRSSPNPRRADYVLSIRLLTLFTNLGKITVLE
jgi:hypothetical protein